MADVAPMVRMPGHAASLPRQPVSIANGLGAEAAARGDTPAGMTDLAARQ